MVSLLRTSYSDWQCEFLDARARNVELMVSEIHLSSRGICCKIHENTRKVGDWNLFCLWLVVC